MRPASSLYIFYFIVSLCLVNQILTAQTKYTMTEAGAGKITEAVLSKTKIIDGHNDLLIHFIDCKTCPRELDQYRIDTINTGHTDIPRWKKGKLGGQLLNIFANDISSYLKAYDLVYRMEENYPNDVKVVGTSDEMKKVMMDGRIALLPSLEGAVRLENSVSILRSYYKLGLRSVTLSYKTNGLADGSDDTARHNGLSPLGKKMVLEMNRLGILADISHVSAKTMEDVLSISKAPVIFSHSNVRALCDDNRNVSDATLLNLKKNRGIIMLTFVPYFTSSPFKDWMTRGDTVYFAAKRNFKEDRRKVDSVMTKWENENPTPVVNLADMADHFDYVKKLIGVEFIGMAGDFDGIQFTIKGLNDVSAYPNLIKELARRGWTKPELIKICSGNFLRVFSEAEQVAVRLKKSSKSQLDEADTLSATR